MKRLLKLFSFLFLISLFLVFPAFSEEIQKLTKDQINMSDLFNQLEGKSCKYESIGEFHDDKAYQERPGCYKKSPLSFLTERQHKEFCLNAAAQCLGVFEDQGQEAVPVLLKALKQYNNIDTGDGIIPIRSSIAETLGVINDPRAIDPLIEMLRTNNPADILPRAATWPPPYGTYSYHGAVMEALGMFGPKAYNAVPTIISLLENKGESYHEKKMACPAARALGKIKDDRSIPALINTLNHPDCYHTIAEALAEFGPKAQAALPALHQLKGRLANQPNSYEKNAVMDAIKIIEKGKKIE